MPIYLFSNPKNENEVIEVIMSAHDNHVYEKDGVKWDRVWTKPQAAVDTRWDENNAKNFVEQTGRKRGKLGDLWEKSAELSEKREKKLGQDPVKLAANEEYKKKHQGKDLPDIRKKKLKESLSNSMFEIDI